MEHEIPTTSTELPKLKHAILASVCNTIENASRNNRPQVPTYFIVHLKHKYANLCIVIYGLFSYATLSLDDVDYFRPAVLQDNVVKGAVQPMCKAYVCD